jgi:hypothetical protein
MSLNKFSFWRQLTDSPELLVRQGEKERIRNRAPTWLTDEAGMLEDQAKNSHAIIIFSGSLGGQKRFKYFQDRKGLLATAARWVPAKCFFDLTACLKAPSLPS